MRIGLIFVVNVVRTVTETQSNLFLLKIGSQLYALLMSAIFDKLLQTNLGAVGSDTGKIVNLMSADTLAVAESIIMIPK